MSFVNRSPTSFSQPVAAYYLENPASGANNIVATIDSASFIYPVAASYTGVRQSGGVDGQTSETDTASPSATAVTTTADNCWGVLGARAPSVGDTTASTGSTVRNTNSGYTQLYDSGGPKTPAGSLSMALTWTAGSCAISMVTIAPSTTSTTNSNFLMFM